MSHMIHIWYNASFKLHFDGKQLNEDAVQYLKECTSDLDKIRYEIYLGSWSQ